MTALHGTRDTAVVTTFLIFSVLALDRPAQAEAPFGTEADINYAAQLWGALETRGLVGDDSIYSRPYRGTEPHGFVLETLESQVLVSDHTDWAAVKRNYGPAGIEVNAVANEREKHLKAITVMFRRKAGYDPDNQDWFWVKYAPNSSVLKEHGVIASFWTWQPSAN